MDQGEFEILKKKEFALYEEEVGSALEPKLYLLLAHLYVEHLLERYIATKVKSTKGLFGQNGLTFEKKVCLAESVGGLTPQRIDGIRKLNALRNNCVHKFKHKPTRKEIDDLGRTLGKGYSEIRHKSQELLLRACCARLCGGMLRVVLEGENNYQVS